MKNKLLELSNKYSLERIAYSAWVRLILISCLVTAIFSITYFLFGDSFSFIRKSPYYSNKVSVALFVFSLILSLIIGNYSMKKNLGCSIFSKERGQKYRKLVKKNLKKDFFKKKGVLYKIKISEAIVILEKEYTKERAEYGKMVVVIGGVSGIVWYQMVEKIFSFFTYKHLESIFAVSLFNLFICFVIFMLYYFTKSFILVSTKLGKINSMIDLMKELEYDQR